MGGNGRPWDSAADGRVNLNPSKKRSSKAGFFGDAAKIAGAGSRTLQPSRPPAGFSLAGGRTLLLGLALFTLSGTWALASQSGLAEIDVGCGATLTAGDRVEIRWAPLPEGTAEFELLLECDLPHPLTLRLTESEDPAVERMVWRVPNVPCMSARLVLRRGEEGHEILWGQSETFRIAWSNGETPERAEFQEGELWLRTAEHKPRPIEGASDLWRDGDLGRLPAAAARSTSASCMEPSGGPMKRHADEGEKRAGKSHRILLREPMRLQLRI
jgi:hypothetical protein